MEETVAVPLVLGRSLLRRFKRIAAEHGVLLEDLIIHTIIAEMDKAEREAKAMG